MMAGLTNNLMDNIFQTSIADFSAALELRQTLIELAVNDELPLDMTLLDSAVFKPVLKRHAASLLDNTRVYGIHPNDEYATIDLGTKSILDATDDEWVKEAEAQGLIWSTAGFQQAFNSDQINQENIFIRIITIQ
jgi:hypothetical protein